MNPWDFRSPKGKPHAAEDYEIPVIDFARSELAVIGVIGGEYQPVDIQLSLDMIGFSMPYWSAQSVNTAEILKYRTRPVSSSYWNAPACATETRKVGYFRITFLMREGEQTSSGRRVLG